jgi:hypothetical protein
MILTNVLLFFAHLILILSSRAPDSQANLIQKMPHAQHRVVHSLSSHPTSMEFLAAAESRIYMWQEASLCDPLHDSMNE